VPCGSDVGLGIYTIDPAVNFTVPLIATWDFETTRSGRASMSRFSTCWDVSDFCVEDTIFENWITRGQISSPGSVVKREFWIDAAVYRRRSGWPCSECRAVVFFPIYSTGKGHAT
jgi:hypothetical protein